METDPLPDDGRRMYTVYVWLGFEPLPEGNATPELITGAPDLENLRKILTMIGKEYSREKNLRVSIWNPVADRWDHIDGRQRAETWDSLITLQCQVKAGSTLV